MEELIEERIREIVREEIDKIIYLLFDIPKAEFDSETSVKMITEALRKLIFPLPEKIKKELQKYED